MTSSFEPVTIVLGDFRKEVTALPLGFIKKILGAINRVAASMASGKFETDGMIDEMLQVLSVATGKTVAELEEISTTIPELNAAFEAVLRVSGLDSMLKKASDKVGESKPAASPALERSTSSTAHSAPTSAGDGTTSTSS